MPGVLEGFNRRMAGRITRKGHPLRAHLVAVARLAARLAGAAGCDPGAARAAGYLHDWAKPYSAPRLAGELRKCRIRLDRRSRGIPALWHGPVAAAIARRDFGLTDPAVLRAVRVHTTGRALATPLEMCLIVADFCEPGRRFREARVARRLAGRNLKLAANYVAAARIAYLNGAGITPHPAAVAFLDGLAVSPTKLAQGGIGA
jgi:predicted HD superfamily hydrolase involved in NAD metabolism